MVEPSLEPDRVPEVADTRVDIHSIKTYLKGKHFSVQETPEEFGCQEINLEILSFFSFLLYISGRNTIRKTVKLRQLPRLDV